MANPHADLGALTVARSAIAGPALRHPRRWASRVALPLALVGGFVGLVGWASWDVVARPTDAALEVAVRDTGIGISADDQKLVFEEFRQVGRDYTNKQEGTGLGLALTRRFVELHGGTIRLDSEPGKGSTFTFTIPWRT